MSVVCFDCDRRIVKQGGTWVTRIGAERTCEGREGRKSHRTVETAARAEQSRSTHP